MRQHSRRKKMKSVLLSSGQSEAQPSQTKAKQTVEEPSLSPAWDVWRTRNPKASTLIKP